MWLPRVTCKFRSDEENSSTSNFMFHNFHYFLSSLQNVFLFSIFSKSPAAISKFRLHRRKRFGKLINGILPLVAMHSRMLCWHFTQKWEKSSLSVRDIALMTRNGRGSGEESIERGKFENIFQRLNDLNIAFRLQYLWQPFFILSFFGILLPPPAIKAANVENSLNLDKQK